MIKVIKLDKEMKDPVHGSPASAGLDLRAASDLVLRPGEVGKVGLGVAIEIPDNHAGFLLPRSGGKAFILTNTVGMLDADYQGQIHAKIKNVGNEVLLIQKDDRIVQLVITPCLIPNKLVYVESFGATTERGQGGFHSTGHK